jgi:T4 RnlA family RNA ligase
LLKLPKLLKLPSFEDCKLITQSNKTFRHKTEVINNHTVHQFSYLLATYNDFSNPIANSDISAIELRGITFVELKDETGKITYDRYLMLPKFFNFNQVEPTMYHNIQYDTPLLIQEKLDGSMITFINIGSNIIAKTKFSFDNDQTAMANDILNKDKHLYNFVSKCINDKCFPIFELVSPQNRIVLNYTTTELRLLHVRRMDGTFEDIYAESYDYKLDGIKLARNYSYDLNDIIIFMDTIKDKEGWVVTYSDNMVKFKTKWYFDTHRLMTGDVYVEHKVIEMILNETIDDVLSQLPEDAVQLRTFIDNINTIIAKYVDNRVENVINTYNTIMDELCNKTDKKEFVQMCKKHHLLLFTELMYVWDRGTDIEQIEKYVISGILKQINSLEKARKFIQDCNK